MNDGGSPNGLVKKAYNRFLRPRLSERKIGVYNGIPVRDLKLLDRQDEFPGYERPLIKGIRDTSSRGDTVLIVGGGRGVSSVAAARAVEPEGKVLVYEGSLEFVEKIHETIALNDVADLVELREGIVGRNVDVWGETTDKPLVAPEDLPRCDTLVLDCEGAENQIIPPYSYEPESLIVETHGALGSPTDEVKRKIEKRGYEVASVSPETPKKDVYVIVAIKQ